MEDGQMEMVQRPFLLTAHLLYRTFVSAEMPFNHSKLLRTILVMRSKPFL